MHKSQFCYTTELSTSVLLNGILVVLNVAELSQALADLYAGGFYTI